MNDGTTMNTGVAQQRARRTLTRALPLTLALVMVMVLPLLTGCGDEAAAEKNRQPARPPASVVVATVRTEDVPVIRDFVARTEAKETIVVQARVEAILASMHFEEGRPVKKGQLLYELDKSTFTAEVNAAKATLAQAQADVKLANEQVSVRAAEAGLTQAKASQKKTEQDVARLRPLAAEDAVPQQDLDTAIAANEVAAAEIQVQEATLKNAHISEEVGILMAEAQLEKAKAALVLAELDLSYCTITCPIDGLIGRTDVSVGNLVGRGEATQLAEVSLIDPMWCTFAISEVEFLQLTRIAAERKAEPGSARREIGVSLLLADDSVYAHEGVIITSERAVDIETGTLQLVCQFPNPDGALRPGQFGRVRLTIGTLEGAVLVPQKAITERQGVKSVLVVGEGNKVALKTVQVSERHEGSFVVEKGLEGGETVIIEGLQKAQPGSIVKPTTKAASAEVERPRNEGSDRKKSADEESSDGGDK